jgi:hypothetical protein
MNQKKYIKIAILVPFMGLFGLFKKKDIVREIHERDIERFFREIADGKLREINQKIDFLKSELEYKIKKTEEVVAELEDASLMNEKIP